MGASNSSSVETTKQEQKETTPAVGIDLGTSESCVAVFREGKVEVIPNERGSRTTPSYVAFTADTGRLIGDAAKSQVTANPENTVYDAKRLIGRRYHEEDIVSDCKLWPFKVVPEREGRPKIEVQCGGVTRAFFPEAISAMMLTKMKEIAEAHIGSTVTDAVITVPAHFNNSQRQATKDAAAIAGINVRRIISEPIAAAMAYGMDIKKVEHNVLVFDLGGGTFNVSVVTLEDGVFEVVSTCGDNHLGGEDFNNCLVSHFVEEFKQKHNKDLSTNKHALQRLRKASEQAKRALSFSSQTSVEIDSLFKGIDFYTSITRAKFEEICLHLLQGTLEPVTRALKDSRFNKSDIHEVILIGGSTRIPKLQQLLQEYFNGKQLNKSINPDEAVAHGAAIQAAILSGDTSEEVQDLLLLDVAPLSLGIETEGGKMTAIIKRNSTIPYKQQLMFTVHTYSDGTYSLIKTKPQAIGDNTGQAQEEQNDACATDHDRQTVNIAIKVYEGEESVAKDNTFLGELVLTSKAPQIEVTFDVECNGILSMSVTDKTGNESQATITNDRGRLSAEDIEKMVREERQFRDEDKKLKQCIAAKNDLESFIFKVKSTVYEDSKIGESDRQVLIGKCDEVMDWLDRNQTAEKSEFEHQQKELERLCIPVMNKLYQSSGGAMDRE